ncbi:hypothetical protein GDO81_020165 [Engystomops pustulosus]|uniref:Uncharacterized protein n=1 Tax=Engystomops pustulosus TaxID=76066 RepID=A0AAV6ZK50_ENGPU|nr:hypothetical protein GDO81_020165 [Engystomops pustulosus]
MERHLLCIKIEGAERGSYPIPAVPRPILGRTGAGTHIRVRYVSSVIHGVMALPGIGHPLIQGSLWGGGLLVGGYSSVSTSVYEATRRASQDQSFH